MSDHFQPRLARWPLPPGLLAALGALAAMGLLSWNGSLPARLPAPTTRLLRPLPPDLDRRSAVAEAAVRRAQDVVRDAKREAGLDTFGDPSGLIGDELSPLVTTLGSLEAKRLSTNPAWASALTRRLAAEGVEPGSIVAAAFSGSFPALNLALVMACEALEARVVAVSSVTSSTWGANQPGFTWPEIEVRLVEARAMARATAAVTAGGRADVALDLDDEGRAIAGRIVSEVANRMGVRHLHPADFHAAVEGRLEVYRRAAGGRPIALYVNVGGGHASMGRSPAVLKLRSGFVAGVPFDRSKDRGVTARFAEQRVKVLMLLNVRDLALQWGVGLRGR